MRRPTFPDTLPADAHFPERLHGGSSGLSGRQSDSDIPTAPDPASAAADDSDPIDFTPVPRLRARRSGWTEERQRGFIAALARCGSVSAAAKKVGLTARTAYRLCDALGADDFVRAWDVAIDRGMAQVQADSLERALHGDFVPVYRRGKLVRVEHRRNDRLAVALMAGRDRINDEARRRTAMSRRAHRADLLALDAARAEQKRAIAEAEETFHAELRRLTDGIRLRCDPTLAEPSIRTL